MFVDCELVLAAILIVNDLDDTAKLMSTAGILALKICFCVVSHHVPPQPKCVTWLGSGLRWYVGRAGCPASCVSLCVDCDHSCASLAKEK